MESPLLTTKLLIPPTRPGLVKRQRLLNQLDSFIYPGSRLVLVTAPAGYGKTTLITDWLRHLDARPGSPGEPQTSAVWFSADEGDNDPVRFLSYFSAALNQAEGVTSGFRRESLGLFQTSQDAVIKRTIAALINEIAASPERIILIIDDYHLIDNSQIHEALEFFLENLPHRMHLVIATREDPPLPLSRLRSRGQISELRASDLRFTTEEASEYLNQGMGLNLSSDLIASLEDRTEGWIAGLQLVALSVRGQPDSSSLITAFTGSHRLVQDFLIDEVLNRQPEEIQDFLLQTSILDQLTASLCDHLTLRNDSQAILEALERANLFIIPQDDQRLSFRYHHLFAELLHLRLEQTQPSQIASLHSRASIWYQEHGNLNRAITHALRTDDLETAIDLIENNIDSIWADGEFTKLNRWLKDIPEDLVLSRPQLCIFRAWELFASGQPFAGEQLLQEVGLLPDAAQGKKPPAESSLQGQADGSAHLEVRGRAEALQAWMEAWQKDDLPGLIQHLEQALRYLPEQDLYWRSAVAITLADSHAFNDDLPAAYHARLEALRECEAAGNAYLYLVNSAKLALNLRLRGHLHKAQALCQERVEYASLSGLDRTAAVGWLKAIWGDVLAETGKLETASERAQESYRLTKTSRDPVMYGWSSLALTRVLFSSRNYSAAERIIKELDSTAQESLFPTWIVSQNEAWLSRVWLAQGNLEAASHWVNNRPRGDDQASSMVETYTTLAVSRIRIALGQEDEAIRLLDKIYDSSQATGNITRLIEVLILRALALRAGGQITTALENLKKAFELAEPGGFLQIFIDEGNSLASLLYTALERGLEGPYLSRLLRAIPIDESLGIDLPAPGRGQGIEIEPLTERETEILKAMGAGLTNPEIAAKLTISLHTVKTHARNIYSKLAVSNRTEAVLKGISLGVLSDT